MKRMSLKWRVASVGITPLLFFVALSGISLNKDYRNYVNILETDQNIDLVIASSGAIDRLQLERGASVGFLNGGINFSKIEELRKVTDQKLAILNSKIKKSAFSQKDKEKLKQEIFKLESYRRSVFQKNISIGNHLKNYTGLIYKLFDIKTMTGNLSESSKVTDHLVSFTLIEEAKENAGKLRANMVGIFSANKSISYKKYSKVSSFKDNVISNINSPVLNLDKKGKAFLSNFKSSQAWKSTLQSFKTMDLKRNEGEYDIEPSIFLGTISKAIGILSELISHQGKIAREIVSREKDQLVDSMIMNLSFVAAVIASLMVILLLSVRALTKRLTKIAESLKNDSHKVYEASKNISENSNKLATAVSSQASGIQETVSSIDEINAMVTRNSESAETSSKKSAESNNSAVNGKDTIEKVIGSIKEISVSNDQLMQEMKKNNDEFLSIIHVINEISDMTKVINDIVFQTKLLSFNASVEAARAGEHGKGFAVVAEEVGNLASMSGKAANEIGEKLGESTKKVEEIIKKTQQRVEDLLGQGKSKVDNSINIADDCDKALEKIKESTTLVSNLMTEISSASREQAIGIQEVTKAMQSLDQVTQENSSVADSASNSSEELAQLAENLTGIISDLQGFISGGEVSDSLSNHGSDGKTNNKEIFHSSEPSHSKPSTGNDDNIMAFKPLSSKTDTIDVIPSVDDDRFEEM